MNLFYETKKHMCLISIDSCVVDSVRIETNCYYVVPLIHVVYIHIILLDALFKIFLLQSPRLQLPVKRHH